MQYSRALFLLCTGAALCLTGCTPPEQAPVVNSSAMRTVRIHGTADATLALRIRTRFISSEEECRRDGEGRTAAPREEWVESEVSRAGNAYEATVALDHFEAGECRWRPFAIGFQVSNQQGVTTGQFSGGAQDTRVVPAPDTKVWITTQGHDARTYSGGRRRGASAITPLDLNCGVIELRGARALTCVSNSPRELPLISDEATEVQVNLRDASG